MILRLVALILLSALPQTKGIPQKIPLIVGKPGDNLTLTCPISGDEAGLFYWYKKMFGYMIETVAGGTLYTLSLQGQFDNPRFNVTKSGGMYFLSIKNVSHEDEGTYFCQSGAAYSMTFTNGTVLTVKDHKNLQKSVFVEPSPETDSVLPGKGRQEWNPVIIVLGILLALCMIVIAVLILSKDLIQTADVPVPMSLTVVEAGGEVTLQCQFSAKGGFIFYKWYKLPPGYMIQTVATGTYNQPILHEQFHNSRFNVTVEEARSLLTIKNVSKEDEATYFCQSGSAYKDSIKNATFLVVNDRNQQKSVNVKQNPETASVQPGDSVTFSCSLLSTNKVQCEPSVYWFRAGSGESHPAMIYTNSSYEEEERSCVYSLSKTVRDSSDTGTYYCAVVTCGQILFGEGTKVDIGQKLDPVVFVLGLLLSCCVAVITVLIFGISRKRVCKHCNGAKRASHNPGYDRSAVDQSSDLGGYSDEVNYAALDFTARKSKQVKKKKELPQECVYSAVRADYHTHDHNSM
ncbi:Ig kappa chain V-V region HP 91A3 [Collichthys lucidus]|uniref:Ig kappa chain V-V region HP 91A3 n=1 Tax=Collichthys lucidus TaxID=240159 RepID=A0A4U5UDK0_COLLU|nr:Ig kappa chain V-V region HP 91A3 [Collichthys lucidus]